MKTLKVKQLLLILICSIFTPTVYADAMGTAPAVCLKFANYTIARVLTWHSPLIHNDPSDYSDIGVKMKIRGLYPRETAWADAATYQNYPSWIAWYYKSTGKAPLSVAGNHRATLALTGSNVSISPTYARCFGV